MALEPENTLRSFRRAETDGADMVELDLHASADGEIVVIHDATLDRTTDGSGRVSDHGLTDLQALDAGAGERIPTFAEVLAEITCPIQVEVKDPLVVTPLVALLREQPGLAERVVLSSFSVAVMERLATEVPDAERGLITHGWDAEHLSASLALGCQHLFCGMPGLDRAVVDKAHGSGVRVTTWIVDDHEALERALAWGVVGVSTNDPGRIATLLAARR